MRRPLAALCLLFIGILTILQWIMPLPGPDDSGLDGEVLVLEGQVWRKEYQSLSGQWGQNTGSSKGKAGESSTQNTSLYTNLYANPYCAASTEHSDSQIVIYDLKSGEHFYENTNQSYEVGSNIFYSGIPGLNTQKQNISYRNTNNQNLSFYDISYPDLPYSKILHADLPYQNQNTSTALLSEQVPRDSEEKESVQIILYVKEISVPEEENKKVFSDMPEHLPGEIEQVMVYLEEGSKEPSIGSRIRITGRVSTFSEAGNPGEFDSKSYYQVQKISFRLYDGRILASDGRKNAWMEGLHRVRTILGESLERVLEEKDASVMKAMLLGDKSSLDPATKKIYQDSSIIHILSISGLHISMIGSAVYKMLRKIGIPLRFSALTAILLILAYSILTGMSMSGIRAGFMFILKLGAEITGRSYDLPTALSAAALLLLIEQPAYIGYSGFLFSFGAVAGIAGLAPALEAKREKKRLEPVWAFMKEWILEQRKGRTHGQNGCPEKRMRGMDRKRHPAEEKKGIKKGMKQLIRQLAGQWKEHIHSSLNTCFSVFLATLPIQLSFYYQFPVYSVVLNMIILPLMTILMGAGFLCMLLPSVLRPAARILAGVIHVILWFYEEACLFFEGIPDSRIVTGQPEVWQLGGYLGLLLILLLICRHTPPFWRIQWTTAALMLLLVKTDSGLQMTVLDVGQGDCIHIRSEEGRHYLVDGGSSDKRKVAEWQILPYLKSQGVDRLEAVFVTHSDQDHCSGILQLLETYGDQNITIGCLVLQELPDTAQDETYRRLAETAMTQGILVKQMERGDRIEDGELTLTCLHPAPEEAGENANADSLVLFLEYRHFTALLTGDVEGEGERELEAYLREQPELLGNRSLAVLKVAHHGSDSSTAESLLELLQPKAALISSGKNNSYGHPHREVLDRLEASGAMILQTARQGALTIHTDGRQYRITTFR